MSSRIRQSFSWWCVGQENPRAFLPSMARIGYQGVEMLPREQWELARDAGLELVSICVGSLVDGLNRVENHAQIEADLAAVADAAAEYGVAHLIVFSGNRRGLSDEQGAINTALGLKRLAKIAEAKGLNLVLELLNSKVDHPDYQCDRTAWGVKVCQLVGSPRVKLLYDIYHMQVMEGDIIRTIRQNHPWIGHYHTAGNPGRNDLDAGQEINYPAIVRAIAETGYRGWIGHEFLPRGNALAAYRQAYDWCCV
jgi:hydroxypyruvate isomerase